MKTFFYHFSCRVNQCKNKTQFLKHRILLKRILSLKKISTHKHTTHNTPHTSHRHKYYFYSFLPIYLSMTHKFEIFSNHVKIIFTPPVGDTDLYGTLCFKQNSMTFLDAVRKLCLGMVGNK